MSNILVTDDEELVRTLVKTVLESQGHTVFQAEGYSSALEILDANPVDLLISDIMMPSESGIDLLKYVHQNYPDVIVILMTAYATTQSAMESIRFGAYDYIIKPFKNNKLLLTVSKALKEKQLLEENLSLHRQLSNQQTDDNFVFISREMQKTASLVEKIAKTDVGPILIRGETGSGKEVIAKNIHNLSPRKDQPFLEINCTSLQEKLLENELFGHERGAFTDARETKRGLFEIASQGTLFLDEIGDIDMSVQAKLLRVLESKKFFRVGGTQPISTNTRIIAATNKNLEQAIKEKSYREDLYYRLKMISIIVPSLRERKDDVLHLTRHFMREFNQKFKKNFNSIASNAEKILLQYNWPGNVRELKNMIKRIILLEEDDTIKVRHLPMELFDNLLGEDLSRTVGAPTDQAPAETLPAAGAESPSRTVDEIVHSQNRLPTLDELEQAYILKVLESTENNKSRAAQVLGISRKTLWEKLKVK